MFDSVAIRQLIDNHVLEMVVNDQLYRLETLLINAYDHLLDIRGTKRNKTAIGIAEVKQLSHIIRFLNEHDKYKVQAIIIIIIIVIIRSTPPGRPNTLSMHVMTSLCMLQCYLLV